MEDNYTNNGYIITTDIELNSKRYGIDPQLQNQLDRLVFECRKKKNKKVIEKLELLIMTHPNVPQLKNYLSVAYQIQGYKAKTEALTRQILKQHPDYIFGYINMANIYIEKKEFKKVPEILGQEMELKALFPERHIFHISEITSFLKVVIDYYLHVNNLDVVEKQFKKLSEIVPNDADLKYFKTRILKLKFEKAVEILQKKHINAITPVVTKLAPETNFKEVPIFTHPETLYLYQYGIDIPHEKINELLSLPKVSFTKDLEKIINDAVLRYGYFIEQDWHDNTQSFVIHAIMFLGEIKAENSLSIVLDFLSYDDAFIEFWLGDHQTESLWQSIYNMGLYKTKELGEFLKKPGIDTYSKAAILEALCQIIKQHPDRRHEIISILSDVLECFFSAHIEDNLIDSDFLELFIIDIIDNQLHELLPLMKRIFEKGYVNTDFSGTWEEIEQDYEKTQCINNNTITNNIFELYEHILNTWEYYNSDESENDFDEDILFDDVPFDDDELFDDNDYNKHLDTYMRIEKKIGRNDSCPCGSGKKYKKCCINK